MRNVPPIMSFMVVSSLYLGFGHHATAGYRYVVVNHAPCDERPYAIQAPPI
jgi:hypothetical protein